MFDLLDTASLSGTSRAELEDALIDLVHHTGFTDPVTPREMNLLSLTGVSGDTVQYTSVRGSSELISNSQESFLVLTHSVQEQYPKGSTTPGLLRETVSHGVMLQCPQWTFPVPVSSHAVEDLLSMANICGKGTTRHSFELLALLSRCLENDSVSFVITRTDQCESGKIRSFDYRADRTRDALKDRNGMPRRFQLRFMYRWDDSGNVKVFSAISSRYGEIPQTRILEVIDRLLIFGKPEIRDWSIDHFKTSVNVMFPEIAEDYAETYGLTHEIMPGIRIVTSDSKDASFYVEGTISIDGCDALPMESDRARISKRHFGSGDIDSLLQRVNLDIFPLYRQYPEKLCELLAVPDEIPVKKCLEAAFRAMDLRSHSMEISIKTEAESVDTLTAGTTAQTLPVYDAVFMALTAHENENLTLSPNQREHLKAHALRAVLAIDEYKKIIEEEKSCQHSIAATASALLQAVS